MGESRAYHAVAGSWGGEESESDSGVAGTRDDAGEEGDSARDRERAEPAGRRERSMQRRGNSEAGQMLCCRCGGTETYTREGKAEEGLAIYRILGGRSGRG